MRINVNGDAREVAVGLTVAELIVQVTGTNRGSAAVVEGEVVPRSAWPDTMVEDGQRVEIVTAVQGG